VRLALNVVMKNDGDFLDVILLYYSLEFLYIYSSVQLLEFDCCFSMETDTSLRNALFWVGVIKYASMQCFVPLADSWYAIGR
jgi:hypothetical protein